MKCYSHCSRTKGFSLVELLIVVGIIAVLLTIMYPVIGGIRMSSQNTQCVERLKHLGGAVFSYAYDHQQKLLPGLYRDGSISLPWSRNLNGLPGANYLAPYVYPPSSEADATGKSAFDCPARQVPATYDRLHYGYSVWMGFSTYDDAGVGLSRRLSDIQYPGRTMLIGEVENQYRLMPYRVDLMVLPHRGAMNALYADGSVQSVAGPLTNASLNSTAPQPPFF